MKLTHRQKIEVYMRLLRHFEAEDYRWRTEEFRLILEGTRREELSYFRSLMTEAGEPFGATWRDIPFKLHKVKECAHPECDAPFMTCREMGVCHIVTGIRIPGITMPPMSVVPMNTKTVLLNPFAK